MIARLFGTPRLVVRTSLAMFTVVTIVLTAVLLLIAVRGTGYVRQTVTDKLAVGQHLRSALEQRRSGELLAQTSVLAESPTRSAAIRELWRCAGTQFDAEVVQALVQALALAGPGAIPTLPALDPATFVTSRRLALVSGRS